MNTELFYEHDPDLVARKDAMFEQAMREGGPVYNLDGEVVGHLSPAVENGEGVLRFSIAAPS